MISNTELYKVFRKTSSLDWTLNRTYIVHYGTVLSRYLNDGQATTTKVTFLSVSSNNNKKVTYSSVSPVITRCACVEGGGVSRGVTFDLCLPMTSKPLHGITKDVLLCKNEDGDRLYPPRGTQVARKAE